jgi:3-hydroxyisobutyrate dehydrogenase
MKVTNVGVVGLDATGSTVACRLAERGFDVTVYDRDPARVSAAVAAGARPARIPADAAEPADVVLLHLPDEAAAEEALFDCGGVGETLRDGGYLVHASTTGSTFTRSAATRLAALGLGSVEAEFLGDPGRAGGLRVLTGGREGDLAAVRPVLHAIAGDIARLGPLGSVATLRMMSAALHGARAAATAELLRYAEAAGVDGEMFLRGLADGGLRPPVPAGLPRRPAEAPLRRAAAADLRLAVGDAARYGVDLPVAECAARALESGGHRTAPALLRDHRPDRDDVRRAG